MFLNNFHVQNAWIGSDRPLKSGFKKRGPLSGYFNGQKQRTKRVLFSDTRLVVHFQVKDPPSSKQFKYQVTNIIPEIIHNPIVETKARPKMNRVQDGSEQLVQSCIEDLTKIAYFNIAKMFDDRYRHEGNIKLNFQPGMTRTYIEYLWNYNWIDQDLTNEELTLHQYITTACVDLQFCDVNFLENLPFINKPQLFVVENASTEDIAYVQHAYGKRTDICFLILSDVSVLLELAKVISQSDLHKIIVQFAVTKFDRQRAGPYTNSEVTELTPLCYEKNYSTSQLKVWQINKKVQKICRKFYVWTMCSYPVKETYRLKHVQLKYLAPACGFWLLTNQATQSMDASRTYDNPTDTSRLHLPANLRNLYIGDNTNVNILPREDGRVLWMFMGESIAKSISLPFIDPTKKNAQSTFGQRFEFLKTSFISTLPHSITKMINGPKMVVAPKDDFDVNQILDYVQLPVDNWPDLLCSMDNTLVVHPRDLSHGPDVFANISNHTDPEHRVQHLLCFQSNYGSQDKSFWHVLDELAKCPFVKVQSKKQAYRQLEFASKQEVDGVNVTYKLTFVYVALNHTKVLKKIRSGKHWTDDRPDFIRCVGGKNCPFFPETVELIVLKKKGLTDCLGLDIYQHLKAYKPPTETIDPDVDIFSVLDPTPNLQGSRSEADVQREIRKFVSKFQFFKIKDLVLEPKDPNQSVEINESLDSTYSLQMSTQTADVTPNRPAYQAQRSKPTNKAIALPSKNPEQRVINPTGRKQLQSTKEPTMPPITVTGHKTRAKHRKHQQQEKTGTTAMTRNHSTPQPTTNEQGDNKNQGNIKGQNSYRYKRSEPVYVPKKK